MTEPTELIFVIAVWTWAIVFALLAAVQFVPTLWRAGLLQVRSWLAPDTSEIEAAERRRVKAEAFAARRRQLDAAMGKR